MYTCVYALLHTIYIYLYSNTQVYTRLTYRAVDGITSLPSTENATISMIITHVNQPPKPPIVMNYTTKASSILRVDLLGGDVDSTIPYGTIQLLPSRGFLENNMNISISILNPMIVNTDNSISNKRYVYYSYTGMYERSSIV